jgi:hypothetical protein
MSFSSARVGLAVQRPDTRQSLRRAVCLLGYAARHLSSASPPPEIPTGALPNCTMTMRRVLGAAGGADRLWRAPVLE